MWVLALLLFGAASLGAKTCVVGAGIAGASCAYRLRGAGMEVVVVERNERVGGRLFSRIVQGQRVNFGGDAWTTVNTHLMELMRELPIPIDDNDYAGNGKTAIFDGRRLYRAAEFEPITEVKVAAELELAKLRLRMNYDANVPAPFRSVDEYAKVGVSDYLTESAFEWAKRLGLNSFFQRFQWEPLTRTIYDQSLNMTLFGAIVSLLSTERSYAARDGNDSIVELLLNRSGAKVILGTQVAEIRNQTLVDANGNVILRDCDHIVLAAPVEMAGIKFPQVMTRSYHHWWVTLVGARRFNGAYFGASAGEEVADSILTLANSTAPWTTCAVIAKGNATNVYKCFSNADISALAETQLFEGVVEVHTHFFEHTFPQMVPGGSFQPVVLGNGVVYTGALESVAVAMECGIISGYNAARLILGK
jgi:hypothetical protein